MLPFGDIPAELYRWFLLTYGATAAGRVALEAHKQIAVLETAWYDVPTAALSILEQGLIPHASLSLALAEVLNMVLGALIKRKARTEGRAQGRAEGLAEGIAAANKAWAEWNQRRLEAEANGQPFNEPPPGQQSASAAP